MSRSAEITRMKWVRVAVAVLVPFIFSCSSSTTVTARRFSGIVLDTTMTISVGTIHGEGGAELKNELITKIRSSAMFDLLSEPDVVPGRSAVLLIEGTYRPASSEEFVEEEHDGQKEHYRLITYSAAFEYRIVDLATNDLVIDGSIEEQKTEKEKTEAEGILQSIVYSLTEGVVKSILGIDEFRELREKIALRFVNEVSPREALVEVTLYEDSEMPELKNGIGFARAHRWKDALASFLDAVDKYPNHKNVHKAYYNAGVAYEYDHQYSLAREFLEQAVALSDESDYQEELWRCRRYEQEYKWRERYLEELRLRRREESESQE